MAPDAPPAPRGDCLPGNPDGSQMQTEGSPKGSDPFRYSTLLLERRAPSTPKGWNTTLRPVLGSALDPATALAPSALPTLEPPLASAAALDPEAQLTPPPSLELLALPALAPTQLTALTPPAAALPPAPPPAPVPLATAVTAAPEPTLDTLALPALELMAPEPSVMLPLRPGPPV